MTIKLKQPSKPGRPPNYVRYNERTVVGLSGPKSPLEKDGRYYSTHNDPFTGKRVYFGRDLVEAVKSFRAWKRRIKAKNEAK